ncbi:MAG: AMP-binding protein [Methylococcus sp.]
MSFVGLIDQVAAAATATQVMTDGSFACPYPSLPGLLDAVDRQLGREGLEAEDIPAVVGTNILPGALTLLACLARGRSFFLLPGPVPVSGVPHFCRKVLHVEPAVTDAGSARFAEPEQWLRVRENPDFSGIPCDIAGVRGKLLLRTSGSMGAGKIVVHDHVRLLRNALNCRERFDLDAGDRVTLPVPIFHMYGLGAGFLPALAAGASVNLDANSNILRYLESERRFQPTVAFLNPTLCDMLLRGHRRGRAYRRVVTSTQRIDEPTFRAFDARFGGLVNLYGSSEMGAIAACRGEESLDRRAVLLGEPMAGVELRLGEPGTEPSAAVEIFCRHLTGFEGYLDDLGHWLRRIHPGEWYGTGDLATTNGAGDLVVQGRTNNSVNRNGHLVLLGDIEKAMEGLGAIAQAVVVATEAPGCHGRGARLTAFCAPRRATPLNAAEVRAACFDLLPRHAIPDDVIIVDQWPLLPSGKVDRQRLMTLAA